MLRTPITPAGRALVGELKSGDRIGDVEVVDLYGPSRGRLTITVKAGEAEGMLEVAVQGDGPNPPVTTAKYGVFYGAPWRRVKRIDDPTMMKACEALAAKIREAEFKAPTPPGMSSYGGNDLEL